MANRRYEILIDTYSNTLPAPPLPPSLPDPLSLSLFLRRLARHSPQEPEHHHLYKAANQVEAKLRLKVAHASHLRIMSEHVNVGRRHGERKQEECSCTHGLDLEARHLGQQRKARW
jgi:hypothetical protein